MRPADPSVAAAADPEKVENMTGTKGKTLALGWMMAALVAEVKAGLFVTATATSDSTGDTSEFSAPKKVAS
jgi:hypothetical protein